MISPSSPALSARADETLPRRLRVRRRREFLALQGRGVRAHGRLLVLVAARGQAEGPRLGITASKKVGGAVQRNRAKRLVRESFRRRCRSWPGWLELVVIVRAELAAACLDEVDRDLQQAVQRALQLLDGRARGPRSPAPRRPPTRSTHAATPGRRGPTQR
jgi:ribonuclease P protein component